jgi:hypothetical protein
MVSSIFTFIKPWIQHNFKIFSSPWKETLCPLALTLSFLSNTPLFLGTTTLETTTLFSFYMFLLTFHMNGIIYLWSFMTASFPWCIFKINHLQHLSVLHSFIGLSNILLYKFITFDWSIHQLIILLSSKPGPQVFYNICYNAHPCSVVFIFRILSKRFHACFFSLNNLKSTF